MPSQTNSRSAGVLVAWRPFQQDGIDLGRKGDKIGRIITLLFRRVDLPHPLQRNMILIEPTGSRIINDHRKKPMLTPAEILLLLKSTKITVDIFDKIAGQVKAFLTKRPKEEMGGDDRWRYKIEPKEDRIEVVSDKRTVQTITAKELTKLDVNSLTLIQALESHMQRNFRVWAKVYEKKDASQDPVVNALVDEQLDDLVKKMRDDLLKIIDFLRSLGLHLDDHYMHVRNLVEQHK